MDANLQSARAGIEIAIKVEGENDGIKEDTRVLVARSTRAATIVAIAQAQALVVIAETLQRIESHFRGQ